MRKLSYDELYPVGRKHCSRCRRWRLCVDFQVREWAIPWETPRLLTSWCTRCMAAARREKTGYKPRQAIGWRYRTERRRMLNRASARKRRQQKEYRARENEYHRIWRDAKAREAGQKVHRRHQKFESYGKPDKVDLAPLMSVLDYSKLTDNERRVLREAKKTGKVSLKVADQLLVRHGLVHMFQQLYPTAPASPESDAGAKGG